MLSYEDIRECLKENKSLVIIIIFMILFIYYINFDISNFSNQISLNYYYWTECGYCKQFSPEWDKLNNLYKGHIKLKKIEMNDAGSNLKKYNIKGFPSIILIKQNGDFEEYNGTRTADALYKYLNSL